MTAEPRSCYWMTGTRLSLLDLALERLNGVIRRNTHACEQERAYQLQSAQRVADAAGHDRTCRRKAAIAHRAIRTLGLEAGRILEVGCGTGAFTSALALGLPAARITATDGFPAMVAVASRRLAPASNVVVRMYDVTRGYPFSERYDLVCGVDVIHHLEDPVGALADRGALVFLESNPLHPGLFPRAFQPEEGRFLLNSPTRLRGWIQAAGWHDISIETLPFYLPCGPKRLGSVLSLADDCLHAGRMLWGRLAGMWLVTARAVRLA